jgi:hypothetical protein
MTIEATELNTGRLEEGTWDAEATDPALYLDASYFDPPRLDVLALDAGPDRVVVLDAELAPHFVDLAEIDLEGWVS